MTLAISATLHTSFDDASTRTRKALLDHGFGVLTEIDVTARLKAKLDAAERLHAAIPGLSDSA